MPDTTELHPGWRLTIDGTVYDVQLPRVTARQVGVIRLLHGHTPTSLAASIDSGTVDLPEVCALAHLAQLQAGDVDFDGGALLDSVTVSSDIRIDRLPAEQPTLTVDADPEP